MQAYKASEFRDYYIDYLGEDAASCLRRRKHSLPACWQEGWLTEWTGAQEDLASTTDEHGFVTVFWVGWRKPAKPMTASSTHSTNSFTAHDHFVRIHLARWH